MPKHTPTPWELTTEDLSPGIAAEIHAYGSGRWIADIAPQGDSPDEEAIENAKLICRAVNCHEELLSLVQWAFNDADSEILGEEWNRKAEAILAKATA